jgi:hypothetical protein
MDDPDAERAASCSWFSNEGQAMFGNETVNRCHGVVLAGKDGRRERDLAWEAPVVRVPFVHHEFRQVRWTEWGPACQFAAVLKLGEHDDVGIPARDDKVGLLGGSEGGDFAGESFLMGIVGKWMNTRAKHRSRIIDIHVCSDDFEAGSASGERIVDAAGDKAPGTGEQ